MAKPKKPSRLIADPELPEGAQAASLVLALCKAAKVDTLTELEAAQKAGDEKVIAALNLIRLTDKQIDLITRHPFEARAVGAKPPLRTVVVCNTCHTALVVSGGSSPKKCTLTRDCPGVAHRASAASGREVADAAAA